MTQIKMTRADVIRGFLGFLTTVVVVHLLASSAQSLFVLAGLEKAGAEIPLSILLHTIWHDIFALVWGGYASYGLAILIGFTVALPVAMVVQHFTKLPGWLVFPLAGAVVMATILYVVQANYFYHMSLFSGTRGTWGYLSQLAAGACGGLVFTVFMRNTL